MSNFLGKNYSSHDDMSESKKNGSTEKSGKKAYMSQEKGHEKRYLLCLQIMYRMLQNLKRHHLLLEASYSFQLQLTFQGHLSRNFPIRQPQGYMYFS